MDKITSSLAAISLALAAGSALAADLPSLKAPPVVVPPPPPLWTGFYFGANVGGIFDASTGAAATATPIFNDTTGAALGAPSYFGTAFGRFDREQRFLEQHRGHRRRSDRIQLAV